ASEGRGVEDVCGSGARRGVYFFGPPRMGGESGADLLASSSQPLFHVRRAVGGPHDEPLNLWSIVLLTDAPDARYLEPFEEMARTGLLRGFIEIYIQRDLQLSLDRI